MENFYRYKSVEDHYFRDRSSTPYRSTVALEAVAVELGVLGPGGSATLVLDVGCGTGSEAAYLARRNPSVRFLGIELEPHLVAAARVRHASIRNLEFLEWDLRAARELPEWAMVSTVWCSQVLSCLPFWWDKALEPLMDDHVSSLLINTLAWPGESETEVVHLISKGDDESPHRVPYNVFSSDKIRRYAASRGFINSTVRPFEIDIDLPQTDAAQLGTYTRSLQDGTRLSFSRWQSLPWTLFGFTR
jgi:SAM-dependent methyltransferase